MVKFSSNVSVLYLIFSVLDAARGTQPTVSPQEEFIASPKNTTVLEGHPAVLRCKIRDIVHKCQWFHLSPELNIFQNSTDAKLIKDFIPKKSRDCSIRIRTARIVQTGQWICKALQIHARKYVVSRPAFLTVLGANGSEGRTNNPGGGAEHGSVEFIQTHEGHLVNTNLGKTATLSCQVVQELTSCAWLKPNGQNLQFDLEQNSRYIRGGNLTEGNCSLTIHNVTEKDEGNWRCSIEAKGIQGEQQGPLVHLHIYEIGIHSGIESFPEAERISTLPAILGGTSFILLAIIIVLILYMYKNVWKKKHHNIPTTSSEKSDYSNYGVSWNPELRLQDQKCWPGNQSNPDPNNSERYLDMTGNVSREGYVMFPAASIRSSMSSRTTLTTIPAEYGSPRTSASDSLSSNGGDTSVDIEHIQNRRLPARTPSVYSHGHLYEEIKYVKSPNSGGKSSNAVDEQDNEGYLVPAECSKEDTINYENGNRPLRTAESTQTASPYSKISDGGLVPDQEEPQTGATASNPMYTVGNNSNRDENDSYDVPNETPIPVAPERIDSINGPLSSYDVPKHSSKEVSPALV